MFLIFAQVWHWPVVLSLKTICSRIESFQIWGFKLPTWIFNKPPSQKFCLHWWEMGLPLDLLAACLSQQQPLSSHCVRPLPSGRNTADKKIFQIVITLWIACCTQQIATLMHYISLCSGNCLNCLSPKWSKPSRVPARCTDYSGVFFETLPGEGYILCFIRLCQSDWLLLEAVQLHIQSGLNCRHTAGRMHANWGSLAVCQGLIKAACVGRGMKVDIMQALSVCVCVCLMSCCTVIYTSPFIYGQSVRSFASVP